MDVEKINGGVFQGNRARFYDNVNLVPMLPPCITSFLQTEIDRRKDEVRQEKKRRRLAKKQEQLQQQLITTNEELVDN